MLHGSKPHNQAIRVFVYFVLVALSIRYKFGSSVSALRISDTLAIPLVCVDTYSPLYPVHYILSSYFLYS